MADSLSGRRARANPRIVRSGSAAKALEDLPPLFKAYIKRVGPLAVEKLQVALRRVGRVAGKVSKIAGPPDVRKMAERKLLGPRKKN